MRRFGQGALGCMEILLELFGDADSIGGKQKGEFYVLSEGPGYGNCESSGSTGSLCYLPILVARQYSRSCTPPVFVKLLFQMSSCHLEVQRLLAKEWTSAGPKLAAS
eukprot:g6333.t1